MSLIGFFVVRMLITNLHLCFGAACMSVVLRPGNLFLKKSW